MPPELDSVRLDELLAHREWVRRVARAVTRDEHDADEVESRTWLAAVRHAGAPERPRSWLATVARNAAKKLHRSRSRREGYEQAVPARGAEASPEELASRAELESLVTRELLALDRIDRDVLLLRYFDGLAVAEVARRLDVPLETARARLRRARKRLRERLSRRLGPDWRAALVPLLLLRPSPVGTGAASASTLTLGATVMATSHWIAAGVTVVLLAGLGVWLAADDAEPTRPPETAATDAAEVAPTPTERAARTDRRPSSVASPPESKPPETPEPAAVEEPVPEPIDMEALLEASGVAIRVEQATLRELLQEISVAARVPLHVAPELFDGREQPNVTLQFQGVTGRTLLDVTSQFHGFAWSAEEDYVLIVPQGGERDESRALVVIEPQAELPQLTVQGTVRGPDGSPLADAEVLRTDPSGVRAVTRTGTDGTFELSLREPFLALAARSETHSAGLAWRVVGEYGETARVVLDVGRPSGELAVSVDPGPDTDDGPELVHVGVLPLTEDTSPPDGWELVPRYGSRLNSETTVARIDGVPSGRALVRISAYGFETAEREVVVVAGRTSTVELELVPLVPVAERIERSRVSYSFDGTQLDEALRYLTKSSGVNLILDVPARATLARQTVTLQARDESLADTLDRLAETVPGLTHTIRDQVVLVGYEAPR